MAQALTEAQLLDQAENAERVARTAEGRCDWAWAADHWEAAAERLAMVGQEVEAVHCRRFAREDRERARAARGN